MSMNPSNLAILTRQCLNVSSEAVVRSSLSRLPSVYVVQLLTSIVAKFEV